MRWPTQEANPSLLLQLRCVQLTNWRYEYSNKHIRYADVWSHIRTAFRAFSVPYTYSTRSISVQTLDLSRPGTLLDSKNNSGRRRPVRQLCLPLPSNNGRLLQPRTPDTPLPEGKHRFPSRFEHFTAKRTKVNPTWSGWYGTGKQTGEWVDARGRCLYLELLLL